MTARAPETAQYDCQSQSGPDRRPRANLLRSANINPHTGLATDYLNHFGEAIMLLEMMVDMPECVEDLLKWQPRSYCEHFQSPYFKARDLAIEAYYGADVAVRAEFDHVTGAIGAMLAAVIAAISRAEHYERRTALAERTLGKVKPMLARAGRIIHGENLSAETVRFT